MMCGDGDMMEGIASEAASLAGHLGLGRLICIYDDNKISIEGKTDITFTEDVALRFKAYGWQVLVVDDGNDTDAIFNAITSAQNRNRKAVHHHSSNTYCLWKPQQAGYGGCSWRASWRRRDRLNQEKSGMRINGAFQRLRRCSGRIQKMS